VAHAGAERQLDPRQQRRDDLHAGVGQHVPALVPAPADVDHQTVLGEDQLGEPAAERQAVDVGTGLSLEPAQLF
jgi:hypothetical protein